MVLEERVGAVGSVSPASSPSASSGPAGSAIRPLAVPLLCWHESECSARTDPLVALAEDSGFLATDRPLPVGTPVFLELSLGHASNAARAQIDAVVVSGQAPVEMTGFVVRFVDVDSAVLTWIQRYLASSHKRVVAKAAEASGPMPVASAPSAPPPSRAPLGDDWGLPVTSGLNPFTAAADTVAPGDDLASEPDAEAAVGTDEEAEDLPELSDFEELSADAFESVDGPAEPDGEPGEPPSEEAAVPPAVSFAPAELPAAAAPIAALDEAAGASAPLELLAAPGEGAVEEPAKPLATPAAEAPAAEAPAAEDPAAEDPAAEDPAGLPSLDDQVQAALGDFATDGDMEDAFSASFSPWVELDDEDAPSLDLRRQPTDPFPLAPPEAAETADAAGPAVDDEQPAPSLSAAPAMTLAPAAAPPAPPAASDSGTFDPFADTDTEAPLAVTPEAAAPLASDEFEKAPTPRTASPAEEPTGFEDDFDSGSFGGADLAATREEIPRALPSAEVTRPVAVANVAPPAPATWSPAPTMAAPPPAISAPSVLPAPTPPGVPPAIPAAVPAAPAAISSSPAIPAATPPPRKATPEGVTPIFGTRPPSGLFQVPSAEGPAVPQPAPPPAAAPAGPPTAPEPPSVTTAPYGVAPSDPPPAATPPASPFALPRPEAQPAPQPPADEVPRFAETQRFGVAPGGPPLAGGFPGVPSTSPGDVLAVDQTERYRLDQVPRPSAPAVAAAPSPPAFRTPTLEFPQPGDAPAAPRSQTPTLREFAAAQEPPFEAGPAPFGAAQPSPYAPAGQPPFGAAQPSPAVSPLAPPAGADLSPPPSPPRSLGIPGLGPEEDVVEVSTTSQIVRASEGGLDALMARDKAARVDMPVQSVTGAVTAVTVEPDPFGAGGQDVDPFADLDVRAPTPSPFAAVPAPHASGAMPVAPSAPEVWFPGDPPRTPEQGPPTGVLGRPSERPVEAWQVHSPAHAAVPEPEELPVVTGVTVLEGEDELPLVQARTLDDDDELFGGTEPWVVGGPNRTPQK